MKCFSRLKLKFGASFAVLRLFAGVDRHLKNFPSKTCYSQEYDASAVLLSPVAITVDRK